MPSPGRRRRQPGTSDLEAEILGEGDDDRHGRHDAVEAQARVGERVIAELTAAVARAAPVAVPPVHVPVPRPAIAALVLARPPQVERTSPLRRYVRRQVLAMPAGQDGAAAHRRIVRARHGAARAARAAGIAAGRPLAAEHAALLRGHYASLLCPGASEQARAAHRRRMAAFEARLAAGRPSREDARLIAEILGAHGSDDGARDLAADLKAQRRAAQPGAIAIGRDNIIREHRRLRSLAADAVAASWRALAGGKPQPAATAAPPDASTPGGALIWSNGGPATTAEDRIAWLLADISMQNHGNQRPISESIVSWPAEVRDQLGPVHQAEAIAALAWWVRARAAALDMGESAAMAYGHTDTEHWHLHELRSSYLPDGSRLMSDWQKPVNAVVDAMLAAIACEAGDASTAPDPVGMGAAARRVYRRMAAGESVVDRRHADGHVEKVDMRPDSVARRILEAAGPPPAILLSTGAPATWAKPGWRAEDLPAADAHNSKTR